MSPWPAASLEEGEEKLVEGDMVPESTLPLPRATVDGSDLGVDTSTGANTDSNEHDIGESGISTLHPPAASPKEKDASLQVNTAGKTVCWGVA